MLSSKLVRLIEEHAEPLTVQILRDIRNDTRLTHAAGLPEGELRDRAREVLQHLGHWLTTSGEEELARRFERLGHLRHEEGIPLDEVVLCCHHMKNRMLEFVRGQGIGQNVVELYAEEELEHLVGRFFDAKVYHVIRGYQSGAGAHAKAASGALR